MKTFPSSSIIISAILFITTFVPGFAQIPTGNHLTIYNSDLAIVSQTYAADFTRGDNLFTIKNLPLQLHPGSVLVQVNGTVSSLLYRQTRTSFEQMLKKLTGKDVTFTDPAGMNISGKLEQVAGGMVFLRLKDGSLNVLPNAARYTLNIPGLDEYPVDEPVLGLNLNISRAGKQDLGIRYATNGISWVSEYSLILSEDEKKLDLSGTAVIRNFTNTDFSNAGIRLVAGSLNLKSSQPDAYVGEFMAMSARADAGGDFEQSSFFEYYVYDLDGKMDLHQQDQRRFTLAESKGIQANKKYRYISTGQHRGYLEGNRVQVMFIQLNTAETGPGRALPAGKVNIYKLDKGQLTLIGQDHIPHTPVDGTFRITTGRAFDILLDEEQKDFTRISDRINEYTIQVKLKNNKNEAVTVEVERNLSRQDRVIRSTVPHKMEGLRAVFPVNLSAGQEVVLEFRIRNER